jgi:hypothetical protein
MHCPARFAHALRTEIPDISDDQIKYWWRGQSVAYLMRLNDQTIAAIRKLRTDSVLINIGGKGVLTKERAQIIPLPAGSIHAHVRHGDKYTEMTLQGTSRYTNASVDLVLAQPNSLRRILYISTEDSAVPGEASALLSRYGWSIISYDIRRSNTVCIYECLFCTCVLDI